MAQPITAESVTYHRNLQQLYWSLSAEPVMVPFLAFNKFIGQLFVGGGGGPVVYQPWR